MRIHGLGQLGIPGALDTIASTIQQVEGYYPGSLAYRNNNPGNLIYTQYYAQNYGAVPGDGGFSKFPDYDTGYAAMVHQIQVDSSRGDSIYDLTYSWLGSGQGGDWQSYAQTIAANLGVDPNTKVADLMSLDSVPSSSPVVGPGTINLFPESGPINSGAIVGLSLAALVGVLILSR